MNDRRNGLTYAEAGVDIDAGNALVERIKPAAARTTRPGVMAGLGGFGALFDLKAAGYADPILVAATDGVGTKLTARDRHRPARHRRHRPRRDVRQRPGLPGRRAARLPRLLRHRQARRSRPPAASSRGIADGCVEAGARARRRRDRRACRTSTRRATSTWPASRSASIERGGDLPAAAIAEPATWCSALASSGVHSNGYSLVRRVVEAEGLGWDAPSPFGEGTLGEALLAPTRIYVRAARAALAVGGVRGFAHITGGGITENLPRILPAGLGAEVDLDAWRLPRSSSGCGRGAGSPIRRCSRPSTAASASSPSSPPTAPIRWPRRCGPPARS